jgi:two-component system, cell cycle sensor histidine kinase and response regulator CckA
MQEEKSVSGSNQVPSSQARREETESRLQAMLLQVQKMELVGQLAGGIAQEFNNLLVVILGNAEIALSGEPLSDSLKSSLEDIRKAADRSAELTSQLLAFAGKQATKPQLLDLSLFVEGSLSMLQGLVGEKISINWQADSSHCVVQVDPAQIDKILTSLCLNARDAMEESGTITLRIRLVRVDESLKEDADGSRLQDFVELSVADTGLGIEREHRVHIFEPFYTTKALGKGIGLGLSTVYGIVRQNRGFINFDSEPGTGSLFRVYLPLSSEPGAGAPGSAGERDADSGRIAILLVEDEPGILNLSRLILEKEGFRVFAAGSPGEAIRLVEEEARSVTLLLTDVLMPEMNGCQLSLRLQKSIPGLKTLFMSGYTADLIACHGVVESSINFIQKPFTASGLSGKVRAVISSR